MGRSPVRIRRRQYSLDERRCVSGVLSRPCLALVIPGKGIFSLLGLMQRAIRLAYRGRFTTSPNPMVGAVVVDRHGTIVGQGYHRRAGGPHAEIYALRQAGPAAVGGSLYVTLEPCNHYGRTPPCSEAIVQAGIQTVHIATTDPNPKVAGGGVAYLRNHGIAVTLGELEDKARSLNRPFITWSLLGRPMVTVKVACSLDGKIAGWDPRDRYVSSPESLSFVHDLRRTHDAILIGVDTLLTDDPTLTYRGKGFGRDPVRVVLDSQGRTPNQANVFHSGSHGPTLLYTTQAASVQWEREMFSVGGEVIRLPADAAGQVPLHAVLDDLASRQILSVLVEAGATIHGAFLQANLVDQWIGLYSPLLVGSSGLSAIGSILSPSVKAEIIECKRRGPDLMVRAWLQALPTRKD